MRHQLCFLHEGVVRKKRRTNKAGPTITEVLFAKVLREEGEGIDAEEFENRSLFALFKFLFRLQIRVVILLFHSRRDVRNAIVQHGGFGLLNRFALKDDPFMHLVGQVITRKRLLEAV